MDQLQFYVMIHFNEYHIMFSWVFPAFLLSSVSLLFFSLSLSYVLLVFVFSLISPSFFPKEFVKSRCNIIAWLLGFFSDVWTAATGVRIWSISKFQNKELTSSISDSFLFGSCMISISPTLINVNKFSGVANS